MAQSKRGIRYYVPQTAQDVLSVPEALQLEYPLMWGSNEEERLTAAFEDLQAVTLNIKQAD